MTTRFLIALCWLATPVAAQRTECMAVDGDQIRGRDMARALPAFRLVPPDASFAPTPTIGGTRLFSPSEIESIEKRFSIPLDGSEAVCFRLAEEPLSRERIEAAMQTALHNPAARIEVLETGPDAAPRGRYEFPREWLSAPASPGKDTPVIWRGQVVYGTDRSYSIWARVRVTAPVSKVTASQELRQGIPIQASELSSETVQSFPLPARGNLTIGQIVGMLPLRSIPAGAEVLRENLTRPNDVTRGELVHVEARMGAARVELTGRAESAGRVGDLIAVRNIESSRIFHARVDGRGSVLVASEAVRER